MIIIIIIMIIILKTIQRICIIRVTWTENFTFQIENTSSSAKCIRLATQ